MAGPGPRKNYLEDNKYFMSVAALTAERSRDPNTQVGACIVKDGEVISVGYNHLPIGDDQPYWGKEYPDSKYLYVTHAILNAKGADLNGASVYTTLFPHNKCAINIIITGIKKVIYLHDNYTDKPWCVASRNMLNTKKILLEQMKPIDVDLRETPADPFEK
ncbi:deoxycytidylate deaminase-like isoform X2 [Eucyclogobius newberryi]|uniref:deoxycytidylate deaminase-like isoform X2 n=1 Tax=Eucyclogobius newberryi TaxID=166745 RepID=UPI003B5CB244